MIFPLSAPPTLIPAINYETFPVRFIYHVGNSLLPGSEVNTSILSSSIRTSVLSAEPKGEYLAFILGTCHLGNAYLKTLESHTSQPMEQLVCDPKDLPGHAVTFTPVAEGLCVHQVTY